MQKGFWEPRTATIDWCEINYEVTYYIAEFWNTISNLVMIIFPLYGIYWSFKKSMQANEYEKKNENNPYLNKTSTQFRVPKSIYFCNLGLILVGVGSWMFHMTLRYNMQLLDELPMVYGSGMLIYTMFDLILSIDKFNNEKLRKKRSNLSFLIRIFQSRLFVFSLILIYCLLVTFIYLFIWKNPIFHEISYSLMVLVIVIESFTLIRKLQISNRIYVLSLFFYLFGFLLWNLDNNFCAYLKYYRSYIDQFVGYNAKDYSNLNAICFNIIAVLLKSIFEFHSLWHLFTGYASFMTILFLTDCVYQKHVKENKLKMDHPVITTKYFDLYYCLSELTVKDSNDGKKNNKD